MSALSQQNMLAKKPEWKVCQPDENMQVFKNVLMLNHEEAKAFCFVVRNQGNSVVETTSHEAGKIKS